MAALQSSTGGLVVSLVVVVVLLDVSGAVVDGLVGGTGEVGVAGGGVTGGGVTGVGVTGGGVTGVGVTGGFVGGTLVVVVGVVLVSVDPVLFDGGTLGGVTGVTGGFTGVVGVTPLPVVGGGVTGGTPTLGTGAVVEGAVVAPALETVVPEPKVSEASVPPQPAATTKHGNQTFKRQERCITDLSNSLGRYANIRQSSYPVLNVSRRSVKSTTVWDIVVRRPRGASRLAPSTPLESSPKRQPAQNTRATPTGRAGSFI